MSKEERAAALITQAMRRLVWMRKYGECSQGERGGEGATVTVTSRPVVAMDAEQASQTWLPLPPFFFIPPPPLTGPELERARNRSATVIQMFWRRHSACRLVADMRRQREEERVAALEAQRQKAAVEMQVRP